MKKAGIVFVLIFTFLTSFAQELSLSREFVQTNGIKPFDSSTNLIRQKPVTDYKKYIGQQLYFLPKAQNYTNQYRTTTLFTNNAYTKIPVTEKYIDDVINGKIVKKRVIETNVYQPLISYEKRMTYITAVVQSDQEKLFGHYFTIVNIQMRDRSSNKFVELDDVTQSSGWNSLKISLLHNATNDTLYWEISEFYLGKNNRYANHSAQPFLLVPYFEKQKELFQGNDFVALKDSNSLVDINTGKTINIQKGETWHCSGVRLIDSEEHYYHHGYYFFNKGDEEIMFPIGTIDNTFGTQQEYDRRELERQRRIEAEREAQAAANAAWNQKSKAERLEEEIENLRKELSIMSTGSYGGTSYYPESENSIEGLKEQIKKLNKEIEDLQRELQRK